MYQSARPPLLKRQIRLCSRNSPTIERTEMFSEMPLTPGSSEQPARTDDVDPDAGLRRPVERVDRGLVDDRVELEDDPGLVPNLGVPDLALDELEEPRPEAVRRDEQPPEVALPGEAGQDVEEVRHVGAQLRPAREQSEVRVEAGGLRVVVAGADVDVAAEARGALAADDEGHLRMRLQPDEPVHDVGAGLLELAGPDDVRLLVEAGLDLDEDDDLLAALGGADQVADDRRVARRPVERHLDREDLGIVDGLAR